jgi:hypothetical protein
MAAQQVTQLDKSDVLSGLFGVWEAIDQLLTDLPDRQFRSPTPLPGWDVPPDGSRVLIELTGALARTIRVVIEGRGRVVKDFGGQEPTSTIKLDGLLFTRLAGGRVHEAPHQAVELGGDLDVAARVVEHLNYVI